MISTAQPERFLPDRVPTLQDQLTAHGHDAALPAPAHNDALESLILAQHQANFDLWHTEDLARIPHISGDEMLHIKHRIDALNQQRNDLAEQIDTTLLTLAPSAPEAPLHSETPGLMIDRLSILALKLFHTAEEAHRPSADEAHHQRNQQRLALLHEQRADLSSSLTDLWREVLAGTRRFKLYRQLKMYNDPTLNPALYNAKS